MSRYKVNSTWSDDRKIGSFTVQSADIVDTHNGNVYRDGAHRVLDGERKPAKTGKGGTVPFYGETAWSDAERLATDLALAERYAR